MSGVSLYKKSVVKSTFYKKKKYNFFDPLLGKLLFSLDLGLDKQRNKHKQNHLFNKKKFK